MSITVVTRGRGLSLSKNCQHKPRLVSLQEWDEPSTPGFPTDPHENLYVSLASAIWNMAANEYTWYENIAAVRLGEGVASWLTEEKYASHTRMDGEAWAEKWTAITAQIIIKVICQQKSVHELFSSDWTGAGSMAVEACEGVNFSPCSRPAHVCQHD